MFTYHEDIAINNQIKGLFTSIEMCEDLRFIFEDDMTEAQRKRWDAKLERLTQKLHDLINS
jgi:hypothetical protein|tara:strand:+ start:142 stop:324 length:183 start_codon:yes stop_codon:yes gene_type:complete